MPSGDAQPRDPPPRGAVGFTLLALLGLLAAAGVGHAEALFRTTLLNFDATEFFGPAFSLIARHARDGELLLWNPYVASGSPHFANHEYGATSPFVLLNGLILGGSYQGFVVYWFVNRLLAGLGMWLLLRAGGATRSVALVGAAAWLGCGYFLGHGQHTSHTHAMAAVPWILWRLEAAATRLGSGDGRATDAGGPWRPLVEAGAIWGLFALAGYHGVTALNLAFVAGWWVLRVTLAGPGGPAPLWAPSAAPPSGAPVDASSLGRGRRAAFAVAGAAVVTLVGIVVAAPPFAALVMETRGYSDRIGTLSRETVMTNAMPPAAILGGATPDGYWTLFAGDPANPDATRDVEPAGQAMYLPLVIWMLSPIGLVVLVGSSRTRGFGIGLALLGLAALLFAVGDAAPLRGWLYDLLPPFRYFRHASHARGYALLVAVCLGCVALADLLGALRRGGLCGWRRGLVISAAAVVVIWGGTLHALGDGGYTSWWVSLALLVAATAGVVAVAVASWLRARAAKGLLLGGALTSAMMGLTLGPIVERDTLYDLAWRESHPPGPVLREAIDASYRPVDAPPGGLERREVFPARAYPTNTNIWFGVPVFESYESLSNASYQAWASVPEAKAMALAPETEPGAWQASRVWFAPESAVRESPVDERTLASWLDRVEATGVAPLPVHDRASMRAMGRGRDAGGESEASPAFARWAAEAPAMRRVSILLERYTQAEVVLRVRIPSDGWVLWTDRWSPGWRATVDGVATPIRGGAFVYRALPVTAGERTIRMTFRPFGYPWLVIVSWSTLAGVCVLALAAGVRAGAGSRRRASSATAGEAGASAPDRVAGDAA